MKETPRIGFITTMFFPNVGGAEISLKELISSVVKKDTSGVLIVPWKNWLVIRKRNDFTLKIPIIPLYPGYQSVAGWSLSVAYWILKLQLSLIQNRFDLTCWHAVGAFPVGAMVARWAKNKRTRVLVRAPGADIQIDESVQYGARLDPKVDHFVRKFLPFANIFIAHSKSIENEYLLLGIPTYKIKSIPHGVDLERFGWEADGKKPQKIMRVGDEPLRFLFVGRNHPKKGVEILVEAAELLSRRSSKKFVVDLVGRGFDKLGSTATDLVDLGKINVIGEIFSQEEDENHPSKELISCYLKADVFVLPSYVESFGVVLIEAMAAGLPVITTNSDGCRDVIRGGEDGIMIPPGDPEALAVAMEKFLTDPVTRQLFAEKSINRVQDFDLATVAADYVSLYSGLLHPRMRYDETGI